MGILVAVADNKEELFFQLAWGLAIYMYILFWGPHWYIIFALATWTGMNITPVWAGIWTYPTI